MAIAPSLTAPANFTSDSQGRATFVLAVCLWLTNLKPSSTETRRSCSGRPVLTERRLSQRHIRLSPCPKALIRRQPTYRRLLGLRQQIKRRQPSSTPTASRSQ